MMVACLAVSHTRAQDGAPNPEQEAEKATEEDAARIDQLGAGGLYPITMGAKNEIHLRSALTRDKVLRGPDWTPGTPPPLPAEDAAGKARKALVQFVGEDNMKGVRVMGIKLAALYGTGYKKWYYKVEFGKQTSFKDFGQVITGIDTVAEVVVGMDGTVGLAVDPQRHLQYGLPVKTNLGTKSGAGASPDPGGAPAK